jgi:hypothetical protein
MPVTIMFARPFLHFLKLYRRPINGLEGVLSFVSDRVAQAVEKRTKDVIWS